MADRPAIVGSLVAQAAYDLCLVLVHRVHRRALPGVLGGPRFATPAWAPWHRLRGLPHPLRWTSGCDADRHPRPRHLLVGLLAIPPVMHHRDRPERYRAAVLQVHRIPVDSAP